MKDKISKKRKKYALALLAVTAASVGTSFSPSAPWVMANKTDSDGADPNLPPDFSVPVYNELDFDPDVGKIKVHYYNVQAGDNVAVTRNTFTEKDYDGNNVTYNNFIVKANDTLVEDSDDIVVDKGNSEKPEKGTENGVTRKYKLKLSETLKNELKASAGGGGGAAPSKLADGTNTTVSGDGTDGNKYTVNIKPNLTGITSITGDTLTLHGGATTVAINDDGVNVGGKKITNLADAALTGSSTDAVTGKQLHETNEKVEGKLDKTAERHIKPGEYTVENGTVTLTYVDGDGKDAEGEAKITGLSSIKSIASGDEGKLTVDNNNGDITITPVVATNVTDAGNANKLATAGVVNTAITNATNPLANKDLSNITNAGNKVITALGTAVVQGDGVTVTSDEDATTGKKTYTISAVKPTFANGTNTTVEGDGTEKKPYKYNVNPALTGITSITGDNGLTFTGAGTTVTINSNGVNVGGAKITNLADAALTNSSTDAVTGKQLHETNEKVEGKLDKTAERHIKAQAYTVENGTVTLKYVDGEGHDAAGTATITGLAGKSELWKLKVDGADVTPSADGKVTLAAGDNVEIRNTAGAITISAKNVVKSVTSSNNDAIMVDNQNGNVTVRPVLATSINDGNKLATANLVNTAVTPLANKNLDNITAEGKKVITGLGTKVVQGTGVTVSSTKDADGVTTYTISANATSGKATPAPKFESGTNTSIEGDGTTTTPFKYNLNPALTGINSITGNNGLILNGGNTSLTINDNGVTVNGKVTGLTDGNVVTGSKDAVTGNQLAATNARVNTLETTKLDKTAERHIKPQAYTVQDGTVTLTYVDGDGKDVAGKATITGLNAVKSITSGDESKLTVANNNGAITVTPVVATDVTATGDANKLATAGVVNTAITNATNPLANKNLSNITEAGKKVITGLGTEVLQGDGVTVTPNTDTTTGKKTYTISALKPKFAAGTNTTLEGDGTTTPYKYNVNPALTGITSITGDTGLTFTGAGTAVTINAAGVNVGGAKVTNLADAALTNSSTDAVTGKQLHETNEKVEGKLDKTAERHIKPQAYNVENGTVTLKYVDANGKETTETATINGLNPVKSVTSGDESKLTVANNNGTITVTPVVATDITKADDANKLATAGVVNTAITNATNPLANQNLSNITDDGKKVITGLSTEVVQGNGITVTPNTDATTGKKTYTVSAVKPNFDKGTNTTVTGNGTVGDPYKYNVNPALTGITSITGDTGLTFTGAGKTVTINGNGVNVGGAKVTNLADAALTDSSTDAVTGKQLNATNEKVEGKVDKTAERHIKPEAYTVNDGTVTLKYVDANGKVTDETATISGLNPVKSVASGDANTLTVENNNGAITVTPIVATNVTDAGNANKLTTASVVNTAINNATNPLANKALSNITDDGKKVITGLSTEVVQGNGVTVTSSEDAATGKKTYTISANAAQPNFANGANTTVEGDGTTAKPYKYNVNPALTGITSITGDTGLTFTGAGTTVTINAAGVNVGGAKVTNLADAALTNSSTDAVTGKQLHETNEKVEGKLDKTAERHIKPQAYTVQDGTVTLKYVDATGKETTETATITGLNPVKSVASGDESKLAVANNNGAITVTPVVATDITKADDANKLATAGVVNTAITNATNPLANQNLSNITDDGKKVITGLSTEVVQGNGVTVTSSEDAATGKKTYTISANAVQPNFANGTNTTVEGNGTTGSPYKYNVNPVLTGITSITNATKADGDGTKLTIDGDKLSVVNKKGTDTTTVTIGKDGIDAGGKTITNVADPTGNKDAANKEYVDAQKWGLKVQNGTDAAADVTPNTGKITLKTGTDTSDDATKPKKGLVIAKDDQGNITLGLEKADRTTLDNAANLGNTASDGRDGKAGKDTTGVVAGSAGAQGPTGRDGLNGKDLTNKVNALRNGEAGTVVYTNAAGERLVKANDGNYYKADEVEPNGEKKTGATAVDTKDVIASLVSPNGNTTGATTKLSNIADGAISKDSKDAVNGSQLFNERVTSPVIFVDKDGNQVFKTADGKFVTKAGTAVADADLDKVHTKVNATNPMTLDNVASAVKDLTGTTYLDKLAEGVKADNKVANSAVNVTDLHAATTAILDKPITFIGDNDTNDKIERKLGETLKIHGDNNITVKKDAANADTLNVALQATLTGITSITNATTADGDGTKLTIDGDKLSVVNKKGTDTTTVTIGKDGINAGGKTITNVADPTGNKDAANKAYVDAQKWGLKVQNGDAAAEAVTPKDKAITLKASADASADETTPKKGLVIAKDDQGNITLGLEKADRTTLDNAANLGNTASDGRDGQAGKNATGVVAGSAGAQGPTGKDGLNGKDLTNKVNALRNGEAGIVVYTNAAGDRLVKANDGQYYKANEVEPNGEKKQGATAVPTKDVIASLVSPEGNTTGATTKLSNIADGAISKDSKDAVNGSQLFNERVTSPVVFVDKDGNQVFKTAEGKFVTKEGTAVADADLDKVHTKVNADKAMTLDNVASAVNNLTGNTYLDKLAEGAKADNKVANSAVNVTDLHSTANALVTKGLEFKGNLGDAIHKNLGETLEIVGEGTVATDATTAANNIRTKKTDDGKLEIGLVKDLTGITSITGGAANNDTKIELGKTGLKVTNTVTPDAGGAVETKTITIGKDGIDAGNTKITNVATPTDKADAANKEYVDAQKWGLKVQNGTDTATDVTPANKVVTFKTGTGTVAPTNVPAGQDSPTKDTDNVAPKKGIVLETDNQGNVTIGLEKADRTTLDHAANIGNTASDGRDGQAGAGKDGVAVAGSAGAQGPTGKDGLNGKDLTSKVNALRNGEAGTVVYTNAAGDRVVKANDGKYYKADEVKPDGNVKTETENGGKAPVAVTPEARLVSPDGTTTGAANKLSNIANGTISESSKYAVNGSQLFNERVTNPTIFVDKDGNQVFKTTDGKFVDKNGAEVPADKIHTKLNAGAPMTLDNVASAVENATVPNAADPNNVTFKEKLAAAAGDVATKHSAVNVEDLHKATADTSDALVTKGLNFQGNLGDAIHKDLGAKLDIVGEGTVAAGAPTAVDNIRTKNVDGKLEIGIVKDLKNITSITNAATADGDGTKLTIDGDKLSVVNKKGTDKTTVTIGKDGINAGGTKITNVAEGAISKDSTDVVIGKQLHVTNEKVSNLEETKLNKTDDVHVKAGTYTVDDTTGTVALPLVKGDVDTATSKNVTISGIVTHAALSNTMDAYELHIAGDKDSKATTTLKKGLAVRGAENFTPDAATKEKGINIQATATDNGVNIKLSDTLTKMKGITFTPAENSKEAVSLTSNGLDNGGHTITNVAAGQNDTDVVNVAQLKGIANVVGDVNNRVNRSSAQSAALAGLQTLQYDPLEPTQISAGLGYYKGSTALALGVGHYKNESTLFHVGASVNGHGDEVMANASVTWKFGSRATESAVKDTYRQGPISASYTLQDKVSALEAQNQIQSEKINAQNQVIEDLKAQLAEVLQYIRK